MPLGGRNERRRQRFPLQNLFQCITLTRPGYQEDALPCRIQCTYAQRNPLGGRLGGIEYRHGRRRAVRCRIARKQAGNMPILAHAQQRQIERYNMLQYGCIPGRRCARAEFGRNGVDVVRRNGDISARPAGHAVVAGVALGQAALVAEINLHMRPVDRQVAQL